MDRLAFRTTAENIARAQRDVEEYEDRANELRRKRLQLDAQLADAEQNVTTCRRKLEAYRNQQAAQLSGHLD